VNLRHLEYFTALAREGHFGRAAASCHVSQPALSMAIRKLEAELGLRLVRRGGAGAVGLTDAGAALVDRARRAVQDVEGIAAEASRLRGQLTGTLRLGVVPTAVAAAPVVLAPLLRAHPGVRAEVRTAAGDVLAAGLRRHELDAALAYDDLAVPGLTVTPLYRERLVLVGPVGDVAASPDAGATPSGGASPRGAAPPRGAASPREADADVAVTWAAVADRPVALLSRGTQHRAIVDAAFQAAGVEPQARVEADTFALLLGLVREGWPTVVGHPWLHGQRLRDGVVVRPIVAPVLEPTVALITPADGPPAPVTRALTEALAAVDVQAALDAP
jgi:DNA-binding transcriptional LysR family regulator